MLFPEVHKVKILNKSVTLGSVTAELGQGINVLPRTVWKGALVCVLPLFPQQHLRIRAGTGDQPFLRNSIFFQPLCRLQKLYGDSLMYLNVKKMQM